MKKKGGQVQLATHAVSAPYSLASELDRHERAKALPGFDPNQQETVSRKHLPCRMSRLFQLNHPKIGSHPLIYVHYTTPKPFAWSCGADCWHAPVLCPDNIQGSQNQANPYHSPLGEGTTSRVVYQFSPSALS
jgi:hypothetical protein